jgi:hypothetical protein
VEDHLHQEQLNLVEPYRQQSQKEEEEVERKERYYQHEELG